MITESGDNGHAMRGELHAVHASHGHAAYAAFCGAMSSWAPNPPPWEAISPTLKTAWIAAAKAARAA
jgi:hypothetical protein